VPESAVISASLVVAALAAVAAYGVFRWGRSTRRLRARLEAARIPMRPGIFDSRELEGLPSPVQRYLRNALREGQAMVTGVRLQHQGVFDVGEQTARWKPFTSDQRVITRRPGFDWDARVRMMAGVAVRVHDAYVAGEGIMHAALPGLFPVAGQRGTGELAEGEFMRFCAEAAWYPTALLPSQGARWEAVDARSARATFVDGAISLTMSFRFSEGDVIELVSTERRGRSVGERTIPTPWQGRFWNCRERGGMRVPLEGEAAWLLPEGPKPYWRATLTGIAHELSR
jgi:hypothetical protein